MLLRGGFAFRLTHTHTYTCTLSLAFSHAGSSAGVSNVTKMIAKRAAAAATGDWRDIFMYNTVRAAYGTTGIYAKAFADGDAMVAAGAAGRAAAAGGGGGSAID